jgi:hypothetical protein
LDPLQGGPINEAQEVIREGGARSDRAAAIIGKAGWFAFDCVELGKTFLSAACKARKLLEPKIGLDLLDRVERVAQFVMRPRLVDEILAGMASRNDVTPTFAARHYVVPASRHLPITKSAKFVHTARPIFLQKHTHSCRWLKDFEPLVGLFHQLTPAPLN